MSKESTSFIRVIKVILSKDGNVKKETLDEKKLLSKLLSKYEQYKDDNVSDRYDKREVITEFLATI